MRIRTGGPPGAKRPFTPTLGQAWPEEQMADAADHVARALSAIDHNLEALVEVMKDQTAAIREQTKEVAGLAHLLQHRR
jgi:hypothetical protein